MSNLYASQSNQETELVLSLSQGQQYYFDCSIIQSISVSQIIDDENYVIQEADSNISFNVRIVVENTDDETLSLVTTIENIAGYVEEGQARFDITESLSMVEGLSSITVLNRDGEIESLGIESNYPQRLYPFLHSVNNALPIVFSLIPNGIIEKDEYYPFNITFPVNASDLFDLQTRLEGEIFIQDITNSLTNLIVTGNVIMTGILFEEDSIVADGGENNTYNADLSFDTESGMIDSFNGLLNLSLEVDLGTREIILDISGTTNLNAAEEEIIQEPSDD